MASRMTDVAAEAGVSIKSVSRVLNDEPNVSPSLRQRVQDAVATLDYVPSPSARALRSSRSYTIHLVTQSLRSSFHSEIQFGALSACEAAGYRMNVSMLDPEDARKPAFLKEWAAGLLRNQKPDGVIVVPPMANDAAFCDAVAQLGVPLARIGPNRFTDHHATILVDDRAAARDLTEHLIGLGHERIGFVMGKTDQESAHARLRGFEDAMKAASLAVDPSLIVPGAFDFETGLAAGDRFLDMAEPPSAVFASNDDMAAGVVIAAHRRAVSLPERLSVVGFDDTEIAEKIWPALTTIRQPLRELGAEAIRTLLARPGTEAEDGGRRVVLPYELVARQSSGPPSRR